MPNSAGRPREPLTEGEMRNVLQDFRETVHAMPTMELRGLSGVAGLWILRSPVNRAITELEKSLASSRVGGGEERETRYRAEAAFRFGWNAATNDRNLHHARQDVRERAMVVAVSEALALSVPDSYKWPAPRTVTLSDGGRIEWDHIGFHRFNADGSTRVGGNQAYHVLDSQSTPDDYRAIAALLALAAPTDERET